MGKRMVFPEKDVNQNKKELLDNYLFVMRENEKEKLAMKKKKIEDEREKLKEVTKIMVEETDADRKKREGKKEKLKQDIEDVKNEHELYMQLEKEYRKTLGVTLAGEEQK